VFPFPALREGNTGTKVSSFSDEVPTLGVLVDASAGLKVSEDIGEGLVSHPELTT